MTTPLVVTKRMTEFPADSHTIDRYEATGGYEQARRAIGMTRDELVEEIKASGLLGRGGRRVLGRSQVELSGPGQALVPRDQRR